MRFTEIWFKRNKDSDWELGVIVNEGEGPLIDMQGKIVVAPIWNTREAFGSEMVVQNRPRPLEKGETRKECTSPCIDNYCPVHGIEATRKA